MNTYQIKAESQGKWVECKAATLAVAKARVEEMYFGGYSGGHRFQLALIAAGGEREVLATLRYGCWRSI